jgi:hypothetical protein
MAKIYHFWMGVPYGTLTILCIMNKILEVFETSGKEVFTYFGHVAIQVKLAI